MDAMLWMMLPMFTAAGSALLAFYIMQARMEVAIAKEREALVEARAKLRGMEREVDVRVKAAEEETRRRSFDDFLTPFLRMRIAWNANHTDAVVSRRREIKA